MTAAESGSGRDRPWTVLVNPAAGRKGRDSDAVMAVLKAEGVRATRHLPASREEGKRIARDLAASAAVVAILGGDGTVHNVGSQLIGKTAWLAVLPGGTENLVCRSAGTPGDTVAAVRHLLDARPVRWDVGMLGDREFIGIAGIGLDGEVCRRTEIAWKGAGGRAAYVFATMGMLASRPALFSMRWDDGSTTMVQQAVFSNTHRYGGGLLMNPDAVPHDGKLDVAVFPWKGRLARLGQFLPLFPPLKSLDFLGPRRHRAARIVIEGPDGLPAQVDGEPFTVTNPVVSIKPDALWMLCSKLRKRRTHG
jgi:diacylglycerol kinase family enzyme